MIKTSFAALALGFLASSASAMPVSPLKAPPSDVVDVKIICEQDGYCVKRGRKPVARWVYGEGAYFGFYNGPGYYGNPRYHYNWFPFWWY